MTLAEASHEFNAEQMTLNVRMLYFGIFSVQQYQKKALRNGVLRAVKISSLSLTLADAWRCSAEHRLPSRGLCR
jgi:hypothetical protein